MAALGGFAALGLGTVGAGTVAAGASTDTADSAAVTTTASFSLSLRVQIPGQYAAGWRASGKADFAQHTAQETVTLPAAGLHALGLAKAGLLPGNKPLVVGIKWIDGHGYVTVPPSLSALAGGAQVLSLPVMAAEVAKVNLALDQSAVALTYAKVLLSELAGHSAQRRVGSRTMDGVKVSGTQVGLTLDQLLKVSPGLSSAMIGDVGMFGNESIPVTVWTDRQGRLIEVTMSSSGKGDAPSVRGSVSFSGYNAPVTIAPPPPDSAKPISPALQKFLSDLNLFGDIPLP